MSILQAKRALSSATLAVYLREETVPSANKVTLALKHKKRLSMNNSNGADDPKLLRSQENQRESLRARLSETGLNYSREVKPLPIR